MPRNVTITVHSYEELSKEAQAEARHQCLLDLAELDHDSEYEYPVQDFAQISRILGIQIDANRSGSDLAVFFQDLDVPGEHASFSGLWTPQAMDPAGIRSHAPQDEDLARIEELLKHAADVARPVSARIEGTPGVSAEAHAKFEADVMGQVHREASRTIQAAVDDLCRWLLDRLREVHRHRSSQERLEEEIASNEWIYDSGGHRIRGEVQ